MHLPDNTGNNPNMYPEGEFNTYSVRSNVLNNLLDTLAKDPSTVAIRDNIWELITANARNSSKKITDFQKAREAEATNTVTESKVDTTRITRAELKEMIKEAINEELARGACRITEAQKPQEAIDKLLATHLYKNKAFETACFTGDATKIMQIVDGTMEEKGLQTAGAKKLRNTIFMKTRGNAEISTGVGAFVAKILSVLIPPMRLTV